jgi:enoyl-CoA hydratase/carnithine racemase
MAGEVVRAERRDAALWLTIDRPDARNALTPEVIARLGDGLAAADVDPAVRVVVVTGAGDRAFCAGGSLDPAAGGGFLGGHDGRRAYGQLLLRLQACRRPTVAMVNGHALAGGLGLVLGCDLAIAAEEATLGLPEIDVGLFPYQVLGLLVRHVGRKPALDLAMTGRRIVAREGLALGLVSRVVPAAELGAATERLVADLAGKSAAVLALGKRAFHAAEDLPLGPALELLAAHLSLNAGFEDAAEGIAAFREKRRPAWKDR